MLRCEEYTVESVGMPSGQIIMLSRLSLYFLSEYKFVKYKKFIKINGKLKEIGGWTFLDSNLSIIQNINKEY